ncbi:esterase E4-like [Helicoverpa zea]|uniref:esterase E4-like n=1 Tax=Helicoverpa zea TaxID=7113 RepID=UPI001F57D975|nr:esterase E4-like [Helicoverpa zea]
MFREIVFTLLVVNVLAEDYKVVRLDVGSVRGEKYWAGDFYEFYGVPYATAPKGRDKFKAPLPVQPWEGIMDANVRHNVCEQVYLTDDDDDEIILDGVEDCLTMNLFVPTVANENNLVPVLVYIHSGAFSGGSGNMGKFNYLARHDVLVISFNYRLGFKGFACLGTEEIPGNAALKDQLAALRFINKYISKFGGDPNDVTLAGFSVGASMAELLALSKTTKGLIHKLILESGSALSPFAINRDPVNSATNLAISVGFKNTGKIEDLTEFLLNATALDLAAGSKNFFLKNSTFGLSPCIENVVKDSEPIVTESPLITFHKSDYEKIPVLTGFANMEGLSRTIKFADWSEMMNDNFADFLPGDLAFDSDKSRDDFINDVKKYYFKNEEITHDSVEGYIDYFSDSMFKYAIMKSAKMHALKSTRPVYLYEFSYVGKLSFKHGFMVRVKGASHRDQTSYLIDFYDFTNSLADMDTRDRMTAMWTDFVKFENPTQYESLLIDVQWPKYTNKEQKYLQIGNQLRVKKDLFENHYTFWDTVYDQFYWHPMPVDKTSMVVPKKTSVKEDKKQNIKEPMKKGASDDKENNKSETAKKSVNEDDKKKPVTEEKKLKEKETTQKNPSKEKTGK